MADIPRIIELARQVRKLVSRHTGSVVAEFGNDRVCYARALRRRHRILLVAGSGADVVGYALAGLETTPDDLTTGSYVSIDEMAVDQQRRRRGVGTALARAIHDWARGAGISTVQLAVWHFNRPALSFYRKLGYRMLMHKMEMRLAGVAATSAGASCRIRSLRRSASNVKRLASRLQP